MADVQAPAEAPTGGLRPIGKIWGFFKWTLLGYCVLSGLLVLSSLHMHIFLLRAFEWGDPVTESEGVLVDIHQAIVGLSLLVFMALSWIGYARFYQRSMYNARQLEPDENTIAPMGMWLWHIVPIAALWMPFKGVRQVWDILKTNAGEEVRYPAIFGLWWGLWIIANIISNISWRLPGGAWDFQLSAANYTDYLTVNLIDMIAGALTVISTLALFRISSKLASLQKGFTLTGESRLKDVFE